MPSRESRASRHVTVSDVNIGLQGEAGPPTGPDDASWHARTMLLLHGIWRRAVWCRSGSHQDSQPGAYRRRRSSSSTTKRASACYNGGHTIECWAPPQQGHSGQRADRRPGSHDEPQRRGSRLGSALHDKRAQRQRQHQRTFGRLARGWASCRSSLDDADTSSDGPPANKQNVIRCVHPGL